MEGNVSANCRTSSKTVNDFVSAGIKAYNEGNMQNALNQLTRALDLSNDAGIYGIRCLCRYRDGDTTDAMNDVNKAISIDPKFSLFYLIRGLFHQKESKNKEAIDDFTNVLSMTPEMVSAYAWRGISKYRLKEYDAALEDFTVAFNSPAVKCSPSWENVIRNLAKEEKGDNGYLKKLIEMSQRIIPACG